MKAIQQASLTLATLLVLFTAPAMAHPEHGLAVDFGHGLLHPLSGVDHLLVMLAVGLWAGLLGGAARWLMPLSFLAMMSVGALLGAAGLAIPAAESAVQASLLVMGLALSTTWWLKAFPAATVAGFFAVFHGYLHGAEIAPGNDGLAYGIGFLSATALLHGIGLLSGIYWTRRRRDRVLQTFGVICAGFGLYLIAAG